MKKNTGNTNIDNEGIGATSTLTGTTLSKSFSVKSSAWEKNADNSPVVLTGTVEIDFEGLDQQQILNMAARPLIINLQRAMRETEVSFARNLLKNPIKRSALEMGLGFADPAKAFAATLRNIDSMSAEQRLELLNMLQAQKTKK